MLGNAVPSLIADVIALEIRKQLLDTTKRGNLKLMPPLQTPVPKPVRVAAVPEIYHEHAGVHEAYPGVGEGRCAVQMAEECESASTL